MASSAAREYGAEKQKQTGDHGFLQCPLHQPPHGLHLTVPDDETMDCLLSTSPRSSAAKQWVVTTRSNDEEEDTATLHDSAN